MKVVQYESMGLIHFRWSRETDDDCNCLTVNHGVALKELPLRALTWQFSYPSARRPLERFVSSADLRLGG